MADCPDGKLTPISFMQERNPILILRINKCQKLSGQQIFMFFLHRSDEFHFFKFIFYEISEIEIREAFGRTMVSFFA